MQRKFFKFYSKNALLPQVAALGILNAKPFERACAAQGIHCEPIREEDAFTLLTRLYGSGCGVYVNLEGMGLTEEDHRDYAARNVNSIAEIMDCYHVEPLLKLEPIGRVLELA